MPRAKVTLIPFDQSGKYIEDAKIATAFAPIEERPVFRLFRSVFALVYVAACILVIWGGIGVVVDFVFWLLS